MLKTLSNIVSYLFHPLLMPTYGCLLLFFGLNHSVYYIFTPLKLKIIITLIVFSFTFLLPLFNLLILFRFKYISSLKLENRQERFFPLIITSICYFGLFYLLYDFNIWPAIKLLILGAGICIFFTALITLYWQISAHMIGIGGLIGSVISIGYYLQTDILPELSILILVAGIVGFSRLYLKAHNPPQVYVGFISSCIFQIFLFFTAQLFPYL